MASAAPAATRLYHNKLPPTTVKRMYFQQPGQGWRRHFGGLHLENSLFWYRTAIWGPTSTSSGHDSPDGRAAAKQRRQYSERPTCFAGEAHRKVEAKTRRITWRVEK